MKKYKCDCLLVGSSINDISYHDKTKKKSYVDLFKGSIRDNLTHINFNNNQFNILELLTYITNSIRNDNINPNRLIGGAVTYLSSYLYKNGLTFDYINNFPEEKDEFARILQMDDIQSIAIITTLYITPFPIRDIIKFIRKYNKQVKIIVGGPFIWTQIRLLDNANIKVLLRSLNADFYIDSSQGEETLVKLIKAIKQKKNYDSINNLIYTVENKFRSTPIKKEIIPLANNLVNWELFKTKLPSQVFLRTSISCPFSCTFCEFPIRMGKFKSLDIDSVQAEMDHIAKCHNVKTIRFIDDTTNFPPKRFKAILKMMIKRKYPFTWSGFFRCQYADVELMELMIESGCEAVHLGIESGSRTILKNMKKDVDIEAYEKGIFLLNEYGIKSNASFIVGFPGETDKTFEETIKFIERTKPTFYIMLLWYCSPLTPIWIEKEKYGIVNSGYIWKHLTIDSTYASKLREEAFFRIKNSIHTLLNLEYMTYFVNEGLSFNQIIVYCKLFNLALKEKILNPGIKEVNNDIKYKMFECFRD